MGIGLGQYRRGYTTCILNISHFPLVLLYYVVITLLLFSILFSTGARVILRDCAVVVEWRLCEVLECVCVRARVCVRVCVF
jgi:hypothetical protein